MSRTLRRLLVVVAIASVGSLVSLSPHVTGPAFAQTRPADSPSNVRRDLPFGLQLLRERIAALLPSDVRRNLPPRRDPPRRPRSVPAPLLGVGWPAIALAGAALVGYRLHQRKRFNRADEVAAESPPEGN
jgi:hypothetical protein